MKIVLAALNAKYVHSNLAVYDLQMYTKEQLEKEYTIQGDLVEWPESVQMPELVIRE